MISTSSHNNCNTNKYKTVSISGNKGKDANYKGECFTNLAPRRDFWYIWHNNIGVIPEKENNKYYIEKYYDTVLSKLDPLETYNELDASILLCYENNNEFCHRHIVAAWFELFLDVKVPEVKVVNEKIEYKEKPSYIKELLEEIIREKLNIQNDQSLREYYYLEKNGTCKKYNKK